MRADDRLIVALDLPNRIKCEQMIETLGDSVNFYKIGLGMLCRGGIGLATDLRKRNKRVFLDLKFFDIGHTVEKVVRETSEYRLDFLTVQGDPHVVRAAVKGRGSSPTKILAVTFLTSTTRADLCEGLVRDGSIGTLAAERARRAFEAGADGVIASPNEVHAIRTLTKTEGRLIITPGIRPLGADSDDQQRIATPAQAIQNGANHIVVGRPIYMADDPRTEVRKILAELNSVVS